MEHSVASTDTARTAIAEFLGAAGAERIECEVEFGGLVERLRTEVAHDVAEMLGDAGEALPFEVVDETVTRHYRVLCAALTPCGPPPGTET